MDTPVLTTKLRYPLPGLTLSVIVLTILFAACAEKPAQPVGPARLTPSSALTLTSPAFVQGEAIPAKYTCQGDDFSPALQWSAPPPGTKSLALIVEDPDAPTGTWVHWIVYNIPPETGELAEGASKANAVEFHLPQNTLQGLSSFKRSDYGGPCPPSGAHHYFFRLYALDVTLNRPGLDKTALLYVTQGHVLAIGELMGTYGKK
jgi:Raf kinase inhibitor-like YbhB/YbcL family protein